MESNDVQPDEVVRTFRHGPSNPVVFADGPGTTVATVIRAAPPAVWAAVIDLDMPARFSDEYLGGEWTGDGPALGASFVGRNRNEFMGEWKLESFVDVYEEGRTFGWATSSLADPGARWRFHLEPDGEHTLLRFEVTIGPGMSGLTMAIASMPDREERIIHRRIDGLNANMRRTVEGIKATLESA